MATDLYTVELQAKSTGVAAASAQMEKLGKQSSLATKAVKLFGAAAAGLSVGAIFNKITTDTINFTKSVSELSAITGATGKDLKFYEEQAALIGKTTTLSASQAADAFKLIASAKPDLLQNAEALAAVTKEAVTLAEAAGIGLADAASTVGVSLNQFGAGAEEASRFVNVLAAGAKEGSSSITDTAQAMKNAGVAASLAGLSFEEANVGVQLLAKGGLFAAEAGTGFRQVLLKLENEADDRFKPSMVGLAGALENLAAENMNITELTGLFGAEAMKSAAIMINGAKDARTLEKALTGTSTATEMAKTNFDNMTGDLLSLNSANEGLAITMGRKLEPTMRKVIQSVTDFSRKVDDFVKSEKFNDVLKAMTIAAKTLAAIMTGQIIGALAKTSTAFVTTATKAGLASTAVGILKGALTLLGGPIGITVTALVGLYAIMSDVFGFNFEEFKRYFSATFKVISGYVTTFATAVTSKFKEVFEYLANLFQPLINVYVSAFNTILNIVSSFFTSFTNGASAAISFVVTSFSNGFLNIRQYVETTKINIDAFYETMKVKATSLIDSERETAAKLATINENKATSLQAVNDKYADMAKAQVTTREETGFLDTAFEALDTTSTTISGTFGTFISEIKNTADAMDTGKTAAENYDAAIKSANTSVGVLKTEFQNTNTNLNTLGANFDLRTQPQGSFRVVTGVMEAMATKTKNVGSDMVTLATNTDTAAVAIGGDNGQGGLTLAQTTFTTAVENTQTAWATLIKDTVTTGKIDFKSFFETVKTGFVTMVSEIAAQNITNAIFGSGGLSGFLSSLSSGFNSIISSIASGIGGIVSKISSGLGGIISNAISSVTGFLGGGGAAAATTNATALAAGSGLTTTATGLTAGGSGVLAAGGGTTAAGTALAGGGAVAGGTALTAGGTVAGGTALAGTINTAALSSGLATGTTGFTAGGSGILAGTTPITGLGTTAAGTTASTTAASTAAASNPFVSALKTIGPAAIFAYLAFKWDIFGLNRPNYPTFAELSPAVQAEEMLKAFNASMPMSLVGPNMEETEGMAGFEPSILIDLYQRIKNQFGEDGGDTLEEILNHPLLQTSLYDMDIPQHQSGLSSVPYDGYIAELHAGERVQTRAQVAATDRMSGEMVGLRNNLNELMLVVAKAVTKTARIEDRWDKNGLPPVRA